MPSSSSARYHAKLSVDRVREHRRTERDLGRDVGDREARDAVHDPAATRAEGETGERDRQPKGTDAEPGLEEREHRELLAAVVAEEPAIEHAAAHLEADDVRIGRRAEVEPADALGVCAIAAGTTAAGHDDAEALFAGRLRDGSEAHRRRAP
jgi:hypothetical protein